MNTLIWLLLGTAFSVLNRHFVRIGLPVAVIAIIVGLLFGPYGVGLVSYSLVERFVAELAVVLILFSAGYDIRWSRFIKSIQPALIVGISGILCSAVLGYVAGMAISGRVDEALYVGVALSATSIGISVPLLAREGLLATKVGQILLGAAIVDDILALYLLSSIHIALSEGDAVGQMVSSLTLGLVALVGIAFLIRYLCAIAFRTSISDSEVGRRTLVCITFLVAAGITHWVGLSTAVGGFVAGASLSTLGHKSRDGDRAFFANASSRIAPFFFLAVGMQIADIGYLDSELIGLILLVSAAAVLGKLYTPWLVGSRLNVQERWMLGLALLPRGEVGLIVASIGMKQAHLSHHGMVTLLLMTLITAVFPAWLLPRIASRHRKSTAS